jgi:hypothetical protein
MVGGKQVSERFFQILARVGCATYVTAIMGALASVGCSEGTYETSSATNPLHADPVDDTAPTVTAYDASLDHPGPNGFSENHSNERFRFDVLPYADDSERQNAEVLYPSHAQFLTAHRRDGATLPSVQTVVTYLKQLDDTIYAGVEETVQEGLMPTVQSKREILRGAIAYLSASRSAAGDEALVVVAAASRLGGDEPSIPADLASDVDAVESDFMATPDESKPIGFYTWSDELQSIWQQDRLLQRPLPSKASTCALASAIAAEPARRAQYETLVALYGKLTNPVESSLVPLLDAAAAGTCAPSSAGAFLSVSETPEVTLFEKLYPGGVPPNADLMGDLIAAIRAGTVDLTPQATDGWYEYQLYALETLLVTDQSEERAKVGFTARYKKRLQEAFSTLLVEHRETHVKQASTVQTLSADLPPPTPRFRLEPLATVYVRHARSYVFLERALDAVLGAGALDGAVAVDANGKTAQTLRARIESARDLFYGLYLVSTEDLGFAPALAATGDPASDRWPALAAAANQWLAALPGDALAASDVRVMVPIADLGGGRYKYWAVIGVRATLAGYSFITGDDMSAPPVDQQTKVWLPTEQFLEVESSAEPLSREELRALCDREKTPSAIQAALEAR